MKKTTCLKCLTYMISKDNVRVNFCFTCGAPVNLIPDDAHKDFAPDLNALTRQELQKEKTESMNNIIEYISENSEEISKNVKRFNERNNDLLDWEKKDWFKQIKKL